MSLESLATSNVRVVVAQINIITIFTILFYIYICRLCYPKFVSNLFLFHIFLNICLVFVKSGMKIGNSISSSILKMITDTNCYSFGCTQKTFHHLKNLWKAFCKIQELQKCSWNSPLSCNQKFHCIKAHSSILKASA